MLEAHSNNSVELREDGQMIKKETGDQERIEGRRGVAGQENEVEGGEGRRGRGRRRRREASLSNGIGEREKDATLQDIRCCAESGNSPYLIFVIFCTPPYSLAYKLYARKKRKFAIKIASRQNRVN